MSQQNRDSISFTRYEGTVRVRIRQDGKETEIIVPWDTIHEIFFHLAAGNDQRGFIYEKGEKP